MKHAVINETDSLWFFEVFFHIYRSLEKRAKICKFLNWKYLKRRIVNNMVTKLSYISEVSHLRWMHTCTATAAQRLFTVGWLRDARFWCTHDRLNRQRFFRGLDFLCFCTATASRKCFYFPGMPWRLCLCACVAVAFAVVVSGIVDVSVAFIK